MFFEGTEKKRWSEMDYIEKVIRMINQGKPILTLL